MFWIYIFVDYVCLINLVNDGVFMFYLIKVGINDDNLIIVLELEVVFMYCKKVLLEKLLGLEFEF